MAAPDIPAEKAPASPRPLIMRYAARSDVGLMRANTQDSAYAGPHLLVVADEKDGDSAEALRSLARTLGAVARDRPASRPELDPREIPRRVSS